MVNLTSLPFVEVAPLPAGAQFLNVIEAIFSGMSRAIIHNSNYQSKEIAKKAIDKYFMERNKYFLDTPKRAGQKNGAKTGRQSVVTHSHHHRMQSGVLICS